jgi:hypothetical protein
MAHDVVAREARPKAFVDGGFIGHQLRFVRQVRADDRSDSCRSHVVYEVAARLPASAIHQRENFVLVMEAASALLMVGLDGLVAPDVGLVYFHHATILAEGGKPAFAHRFADAMAHDPSRFESDTE